MKGWLPEDSDRTAAVKRRSDDDEVELVDIPRGEENGVELSEQEALSLRDAGVPIQTDGNLPESDGEAAEEPATEDSTSTPEEDDSDSDDFGGSY